MKICIVILCLINVVACGSSESATNDDEKRLGYELLYQANEHTLSFPKLTIVNSKSDLYAVYNELNKTRMPGLPLPEANFSKETIVVFSYHIENDSSNDLEIEKTYANESTLKLKVKEILNLNQANNKVFKHPFFIIKIDGVYKNVEVVQ